MAKYSSAPTIVNRPATVLSEKFSDFRAFQTALDNLDAEQRATVGDVLFTEDSITITTPQVGAIVLRATERTPDSRPKTHPCLCRYAWTSSPSTMQVPK